MPHKDPVARQEYSKKYRSANSESLKAIGKEYYEKDIEGNRAKRREYYQKNKDKIKAKVKDYRRKNPEKIKSIAKNYYQTKKANYSPKKFRERRLINRYGLTTEAFDSMLRGQGGVCAICKTDEWSIYGPFVDHDHKTGVVRGLLCHKCNWAIGLLKENHDTILRAHSYVSGGNDER